MQISGKVELGFEPVRELFTRSLTSKRDRNAQLCVYVGENRVVDLWATNGAEPFSPDSLVNVFSSGKSIECILLAYRKRPADRSRGGWCRWGLCFEQYARIRV